MGRYKIGVIYIASNKYMPNCYKIGYTTGPVEKRLKNLFNSSVPNEFEASFVSGRKTQVDILEQLIHRKLSEYKTHHSREFYYANIDWLVSEVASIVAEFRPEPPKIKKLNTSELSQGCLESAYQSVINGGKPTANSFVKKVKMNRQKALNWFKRRSAQ